MHIPNIFMCNISNRNAQGPIQWASVLTQAVCFTQSSHYTNIGSLASSLAPTASTNIIKTPCKVTHSINCTSSQKFIIWSTPSYFEKEEESKIFWILTFSIQESKTRLWIDDPNSQRSYMNDSRIGESTVTQRNPTESVTKKFKNTSDLLLNTIGCYQCLPTRYTFCDTCWPSWRWSILPMWRLWWDTTFRRCLKCWISTVLYC